MAVNCKKRTFETAFKLKVVENAENSSNKGARKRYNVDSEGLDKAKGGTNDCIQQEAAILPRAG